MRKGSSFWRIICILRDAVNAGFSLKGIMVAIISPVDAGSSFVLCVEGHGLMTISVLFHQFNRKLSQFYQQKVQKKSETV